LRHDDPSYVNIKDYVFDPLPPSKKRIRLLQLDGNTLHSPSIHCKLVEADYDNAFHIPTRAISESSEDLRRYRNELQQIEDPNERLRKQYEWVNNKRMNYEALSWCWGKDNPDHAVIIERAGEYYKMRVRRDLALALKYLRHPNKVR
jgi:hypothetical protein